jgi:hypothetical protein
MSQTNGTEQLVKTRTLSWKEIVQKSLGTDKSKPEPGYEFSGGRKFDTPNNGGPYRDE